MKILEQTPDRLRMSLRWPTALTVLFCAAWGLAAFFTFRSEVIEGERANDGTVNLQVSSRFFGLPVSQRRFDGVSHASVETYRSISTSDGIRSTNILYRVMLETPQGSVPYSRHSSTELQHWTRLAERLDAFIQDSNTASFRFVSPPGWVGWLMLGVFALVVVGLGFQQGGELLIDKANDEVTLTKMGIPKPRAQRFRLSEIEGFDMVANPRYRTRHGISVGRFNSRQFTSRNDSSHWLVMRLVSGQEMTLASFWTASGCRSAMSTLKQFCGVLRPSVIPKPEPQDQARTLTVPLVGQARKVCVICGSDCSSEPRFQDDQGRYYHQRCHSPGSSPIAPS